MTPTPAADGICATSRLLPFPRSKVFEAFADATCLATWWGPEGFRNTFDVFEFRPQGQWKFVMHGPDGTDYPNESIFLDVSPARVVIRHVSAPHFTLTVTLADQAEATMLHWRQAFDDPKVAAAVWHIIEPANEQNLNRLHNALSAKSAQDSPAPHAPD
jgi:uncharacterized protein YndB with AHSA1/START domain